MSHALPARTVTIVAGVSQSGKSTFAIRYLLNAPLSYRFVFDPGVGSESYAERLGLPAATDEHSLSVSLCRGWVLFNPHRMFPGRLFEAYSFFCEWTYKVSERLPGRKIKLTDEAWRYVTPRRYPQELAFNVQSGGHQGIECMFNTTSPYSLHEAIQNECSEAVCFQLCGDKNLEWARGRGFAEEELKGLPKLHFISRVQPSGGELRGRIEV